MSVLHGMLCEGSAVASLTSGWRRALEGLETMWTKLSTRLVVCMLHGSIIDVNSSLSKPALILRVATQVMYQIRFMSSVPSITCD